MSIRRSLVVSDETDRSLRSYLTRTGGSSPHDLAKQSIRNGLDKEATISSLEIRKEMLPS